MFKSWMMVPLEQLWLTAMLFPKAAPESYSSYDTVALNTPERPAPKAEHGAVWSMDTRTPAGGHGVICEPRCPGEKGYRSSGVPTR